MIAAALWLCYAKTYAVGPGGGNNIAKTTRKTVDARLLTAFPTKTGGCNVNLIVPENGPDYDYYFVSDY